MYKCTCYFQAGHYGLIGVLAVKVVMAVNRSVTESVFSLLLIYKKEKGNMEKQINGKPTGRGRMTHIYADLSMVKKEIAIHFRAQVSLHQYMTASFYFYILFGWLVEILDISGCDVFF